MADPDEALTGRESSAASAEASPALIEAIAGRIRYDLKARTIPPDPITGLGGMGLTEYDIARAAYAAMVEHLGLVDERAREIGPGVNRPMRRLVSKWVETDA